METTGAVVINRVQHGSAKRTPRALAKTRIKDFFKVAVRDHRVELGRHELVEEFYEPLRELSMTPLRIGDGQAFGGDHVQNAGNRIPLLLYRSIIGNQGCLGASKYFKTPWSCEWAEYVETNVLPR